MANETRALSVSKNGTGTGSETETEERSGSICGSISLERAKKIEGVIVVPGDKSISHRGLICGALAHGKTVLKGLLPSEDVQATRKIFQKLGVSIEEGRSLRKEKRKNEKDEGHWVVQGKGRESFLPCADFLNCQNSGTTMRLMMGVLAGCPHEYLLRGDESLEQRPMQRVASPLKEMGVAIDLRLNNFAPIKLRGAEMLRPLHFSLETASAQVKSALLLAALCAEGESVLTGKLKSRNHTERLLPYFGADLLVEMAKNPDEGLIKIKGPKRLEAQMLEIPGDQSSLAFWTIPGLLLPHSQIEFPKVSLNPTRMGLLHVIQRMGGKVDWEIDQEHPEESGTVWVRSSSLQGITVEEDEIPAMIDEIPVLAVLACYAEGLTRIKGLTELKVKESNRLQLIYENLKRMQAKIELNTQTDELVIHGPCPLQGAKISTAKDHRMVMAFSMAALVAEGKTEIEGQEWANISYPQFFETLKRVVRF